MMGREEVYLRLSLTPLTPGAASDHFTLWASMNTSLRGRAGVPSRDRYFGEIGRLDMRED